MLDSTDVVHIWHRAGNPTPVDRLSLYAQALTADCPIGAYRTLNDAQEDRAILALFRVDRPHATIPSLHQVPPLALSGYHQLLHDLAREGLGPSDGFHAQAPTFGHSPDAALRRRRTTRLSTAANCETPQPRSHHRPVRSRGYTPPDSPPPVPGAGATPRQQPGSLGCAHAGTRRRLRLKQRNTTEGKTR